VFSSIILIRFQFRGQNILRFAIKMKNSYGDGVGIDLVTIGAINLDAIAKSIDLPKLVLPLPTARDCKKMLQFTIQSFTVTMNFRRIYINKRRYKF